MSEQTKLTSQMVQDSPPNRRQAMRFFIATSIGGAFLVLAGTTLTGTVIALIMATPLLILLSPILVPAATILSLVATGFVFSGGCVVAALAMMMWMYNYYAAAGKQQLEYYRMKIARELKERAKEQGAKTQENAIQGS